MSDSMKGGRRCSSQSGRRPRLGFVGVGWIGLHRLEAVAKSGLADIAVLADAAPERTFEAARVAPEATLATCFDQLLEMRLDGLVIATPNAFHVAQSIAALDHGIAVFCQKPLGRTAAETARVIDAARSANRLLGVDLSYRGLYGLRKIRDLLQSGELGKLFAAELVFHNAYGPDKPWFYNSKLSGGGCVLDLGIHLVDLALWCLGFPKVVDVSSKLFSQGVLLENCREQIEDYALARLTLDNGVVVQISCSWRLPVGCDAIITGSFYGSQGGARFRNVNGSFTDFVAERCRGTQTEQFASPPDSWGGRAVLDWTEQLAQSSSYDSEIETLVPVASVLDQIYGHTE